MVQKKLVEKYFSTVCNRFQYWSNNHGGDKRIPLRSFITGETGCRCRVRLIGSSWQRSSRRWASFLAATPAFLTASRPIKAFCCSPSFVTNVLYHCTDVCRGGGLFWEHAPKGLSLPPRPCRWISYYFYNIVFLYVHFYTFVFYNSKFIRSLFIIWFTFYTFLFLYVRSLYSSFFIRLTFYNSKFLVSKNFATLFPFKTS